MDDVVDLIDRFADRGQQRGAQRVLDDARRGTVASERRSPAPAPRRRGRIAIAVLAGVVVVGAAFLGGRDNPQPDPADRNSDTVLDGVSDADAAELCKAFAPLSAEANQSRSALDPETSASALFAKQNLDLIDGDEPTTTMTQEQFRVGILRLRRSDTELELACTARGHDPIFGQLSGSSDTPPTTATR
jgi:hypothetical protein